MTDQRNKTPTSFPPENFLDELHSDLCGPFPTESIVGHKKYFSVIVDKKTRYTWIAFHRHKSDYEQYFIVMMAFLKNQFGKVPKKFHFDGGGEFDNSIVRNSCSKHGIQFSMTAPASPSQNPFSERMNRTIQEGAKAMLNQSNLPAQFWAEAMNHFVLIKNQSPNKSLGMKTNPLAEIQKEHKHFSVPNISRHQHGFGTLTFAYEEHTKGKNPGIPCLYLGRDTTNKAARLFDLNKQAVILRKVIKSIPGKYPGKIKYDNRKQADPLVSIIESQPIPTQNTTDPVLIPTSGAPDIPQSPTHDLQIPRENFPDLSFVDPVTSSDDDDTPAPPRRSTREKAQVDHGPVITGHAYNVSKDTFDDIKIPKNIKKAKQSPYATHWLKAVLDELKALHLMGTWEIVSTAGLNITPIDCRWVFDLKRNEDSSIRLFKARLTAKGFMQQEGTDYHETYAPVARTESFRMIVGIAAIEKLGVTQVDFKNAFLNGEIDEDIYMHYPPGYPGQPGTVLKLRRALYGLKQSPRIWYLVLRDTLKELGFEPTEGDPCVFKHTKEKFFISMHVDDLILATANEKLRKKVVDALAAKFRMKDLGRLHKYLGIRVQHHPDGSITLDQEQYIREKLGEYNMENSNSKDTPVDPHIKLTKDMSPQTESDKEEMASKPYRAIVGALNYALSGTRPDIAFPLITCAKYMANPGKTHWTALQHILRYLKGTTRRAIRFGGEGVKLKLWGMSDSDWANDLDTRKSTLGYIVYLGNGPVAWKSTKQKTAPAQSSAEAEFIALVELIKEILWFRNMLAELNVQPITTPLDVYLDNEAAKSIAEAGRSMRGVKHVDTKLLMLRHHVLDGSIKLHHVSSADNTADLFTKAYTIPVFNRLIGNLMCDLEAV
jgi:hypothetical protein